MSVNIGYRTETRPISTVSLSANPGRLVKLRAIDTRDRRTTFTLQQEGVPSYRIIVENQYAEQFLVAALKMVRQDD